MRQKLFLAVSLSAAAIVFLFQDMPLFLVFGVLLSVFSLLEWGNVWEEIDKRKDKTKELSKRIELIERIIKDSEPHICYKYKQQIKDLPSNSYGCDSKDN